MTDFSNPMRTYRTINGQPGSMPFYTAYLPGYAGYATPTDMFSLRGAAGKLCAVRIFGMLIGQTVSAKMTATIFRRASLNTGGTVTNISPARYDNRDPAPSANVRVYTTAPVITDAAPTFAIPAIGVVAALTATPGGFQANGTGLSIVNSPIQDVCTDLIIAENQELTFNYGGGALAGGFLGVPFVQWAEYDA